MKGWIGAMRRAEAAAEARAEKLAERVADEVRELGVKAEVRGRRVVMRGKGLLLRWASEPLLRMLLAGRR